MTGQYARGTTVQPEKSQQEIMAMLRKYGATSFMSGWEGSVAAIAFVAYDRRVRFVLQLPDWTDPRFAVDGHGRRRGDAQRHAAHEAEVRRLWRALALAIKAKLEVVESGIATFEDEFLANIVLPDGTTVGERAKAEVARVYEFGGHTTSILALPSGGSE